MNTYLVTGGAGFIGSHLVRRLVRLGHRVRVLDNFSTGRRANLAEVAARVELVEGDVADPAVAHRAVDGVEYVLHQAALPSVPRSIADPLTTHHSNVEGTLQLLIAARDAGVRRVVQASSSSVYGDTETLPKAESHPLAPRSPYAASKAAGEHYGHAFFRSYGVPYVALRYFNVFGPGQDPASQYAAVIPRFIRAYLRGETPVVVGDGLQSRDFCFVENVVNANLLACQSTRAPGHSLNVACGERTTLLGVLELLAEHVGRRLPPRHDPPRPADVRHSLADLTLSHDILGYRPEVLFPEGLRRTVDWFRAHLSADGALDA
ncbi:MAG: SDR family oxidoreductase [Deltaproteobacteria bacterium]|nr:SDR family oxidoreductase [Deltaproteobacteria bacterium]